MNKFGHSVEAYEFPKSFSTNCPPDASVLPKPYTATWQPMMTDTRVKEEIENRLKIREWLEMAGYKMSNTKGEPSVTRISLMSCYRWQWKMDGLRCNIAAGMTMGNKKEPRNRAKRHMSLHAHGSKGLEWKKSTNH